MTSSVKERFECFAKGPFVPFSLRLKLGSNIIGSVRLETNPLNRV